MTRLYCITCSLLVGMLLGTPLLPSAAAQQTHSLDIRDGTVYIDDQAVPESQLPSGLDLEGISAHYRFVGIKRPVIELKGQLYAIDDGLKPVSKADVAGDQASVILRERPVQMQGRRSPESTDTRVARQQYLNDVQQTSRELYERLLRERRMEQQAQDLAQVIRLLPEGGERRAKIDSLRAMLNQIFDIKQENRRREIERLQQKIQELQRSLQERRKMRETMIDRRLQQLLGTTDQR